MGYSYREMPKSPAFTEGMKRISADENNLRMVIGEDVVYAEKDGKELHLRVLYPMNLDGIRTVRPTLIHVQGSAWMKQDMNNHVGDLKEIVTGGYNVLIVEYRESAIALSPAQIYDAKDAVRYVVSHAEELYVDPDHLYVSGDSSGGHTALMMWATWHTQHLDEGNTPLPSIRAFVDFYGVADLIKMSDYTSSIRHDLATSPEGLLLGGAPKEKLQENNLISVFTYLDEKTVHDPLLILHGNKDRLVPFEQSVLLYEACVKNGKDAEFYCVDNADHGGAGFWCKAVYELVIAFLKNHAE